MTIGICFHQFNNILINARIDDRKYTGLKCNSVESTRCMELSGTGGTCKSLLTESIPCIVLTTVSRIHTYMHGFLF